MGGAVFAGFTVGYRNYEIYVNHTPGSDLRRQNGMFLLLEHTVDGRTTNPVSAEETVSKCRKTLELSEDRSGKDR